MKINILKCVTKIFQIQKFVFFYQIRSNRELYFFFQIMENSKFNGLKDIFLKITDGGMPHTTFSDHVFN